MNPRVLIIEDDPDGRRSVQECVADLGYEVSVAAQGREGVALFQQREFDAVLTDLVLPDIDGLEVLQRIVKLSERTPVIIMTAYGSVPSSVKALQSGAYDYITKPLDLDDLQSKVKRAVETAGLRIQVSRLKQAVHQKYSAASMIATAPAMRDMIRQIEALASTNATVLIRGESGAGKELVARALHVDSRRAAGPFVAVNCGAFSQTLLESELFGHEKGSFTGATQQHKGAFERADGGTLFLDEIGDAPLSVQVKLLRVLEDREIIRVGGQSSFKVDVRLVSATHKDLDDMVAEGEFREDLLYRLKVVTLDIPPLRQRREDIRPLADRFIALACEEHARSIEAVEPAYYEKLESYDWPGNIRQLRNVVETSVIMAMEPVLTPGLLRIESPAAVSKDGFVVPGHMTLADLEKEILSQSLKRNEGNRSLTADQLGISRRTIQRKIKDYNLPY